MDENTLRLLLLPAVVGVTEAAKQAGMPVRFAAAAAILIGGIDGILIGIGYGHSGNALILAAASGLAIGAGASGVYAVADKFGTTVTVQR